MIVIYELIILFFVFSMSNLKSNILIDVLIIDSIQIYFLIISISYSYPYIILLYYLLI